MCRWPLPDGGFAFSFPSSLLPPARRLPRVSVVTEFAKVPLSGLVHAPPSSPPGARRASQRASIAEHSTGIGRPLWAAPAGPSPYSQYAVRRSKEPLSLAVHPPRLSQGCAVGLQISPLEPGVDAWVCTQSHSGMDKELAHDLGTASGCLEGRGADIMGPCGPVSGW